MLDRETKKVLSMDSSSGYFYLVYWLLEVSLQVNLFFTGDAINTEYVKAYICINWTPYIPSNCCQSCWDDLQISGPRASATGNLIDVKTRTSLCFVCFSYQDSTSLEICC